MQLQAVKIQKFHSPQCVTNFLFSQFSGPRPWNTRFHKSNDLENYIDCAETIFVNPVGNRSFTTTNALGISWFHNIHCLFTAICSGNSRYRERCSFCSQSVWAKNVVAIYRGLTVINFNDFPTFRLILYLALQSNDTQKSQTLQSQIYRLNHRKMENIKQLKLKYIMKCFFSI